MIITLKTPANELSTYVIPFDVLTEANDSATPKTLTWTLMDDDSQVLWDLDGVSMALTATRLVLKGAQLAMVDQTKLYEYRRVLIAATYDSDIGTDNPVNVVVRFVLHGRKILPKS